MITPTFSSMNNKHIGSSMDDFLAEEGLLEDATASATKRVIAWQIEREMKEQKFTVQIRHLH